MRLVLKIHNIFLISFSVYVFSCPGDVIDKNINDQILFTGRCLDENVRVWGETDWINNGDTFIGFHYPDGDRKAGTYSFKSGEYIEGIWQEKIRVKNNLEYDLIGRYYYDSGTSTFGHHLGSSLNGFGAVFYENDEFDGGERDYEVGIWEKDTETNRSTLAGYGVRAFKKGLLIYGFWGDGGLIGDGYWVEEDGSREKYSFNRGKIYGPYSLNSSDKKRLNQIKDFLTSNLTEINDFWDEFEEVANEYEKVSSSFLQNEEPFNYEQNYSELVQSIQELLTELGYSPGPIDGYLGERTSAAIKAFEYELDLEEITGIPSEEILVALQLTIRAKNASSNPTQKSEPIFLGTGSGFYINKNHIVTNHHVIEKCEYQTDSEDRDLDIKVSDIVNDITLLRGPESNNFMSISESAPELGEKIYVSGFPLNSTLNSFMITSGNVSSLTGFGKNFSNFSHTAPSQPGNSGGPIINEYGSVVGILVAGINEEFIKEISGTLPQNINFGVKNTVLKSLLTDNSTAYTSRDAFFSKSQKNIADIAKKSAVLIKCYGYPETK
jgi:S1-C subfamily serine protease